MNEIIPEDWQKGTLGDLCLSIRGVSYKPENLKNIKSINTVTLLRSNNIQEHGIHFSDVKYVDIKKVKQKQMLVNGDIAVCMSNGSKRLVGKNYVLSNLRSTETFTVGAFCSIVRTNEKNVHQFVRYLLNSDAFKKQVGFSLAGSAINNLKDGDLESYHFLLPPLPEQKKIASILTSVDEVIEKTQLQIDKLQDLKKGTMNELLTKGIGHTEFKDSELGRIPKSWEVKRLKDIGECVRGLTYSPSDVSDHGLLVLRSSNIQNNRLDFDDSVYVNLKIDDRFKTKENDILICVRNGSHRLIGKNILIAKVLINSTHGAFMTVFRSNINLYVQYLMQSDLFYRYISRDIGATINSINNGNLIEYQFSFPPIQEQNKIISILSSIDKNIIKAKDKLCQTQSLKKSLMQDLLTGKVRVTVN